MISNDDRPNFGQGTDPTPPPRTHPLLGGIQPDHLLNFHLQDALLTTSKLQFQSLNEAKLNVFQAARDGRLWLYGYGYVVDKRYNWKSGQRSC